MNSFVSVSDLCNDFLFADGTLERPGFGSYSYERNYICTLRYLQEPAMIVLLLLETIDLSSEPNNTLV